jgi:hypothetical protein
MTRTWRYEIKGGRVDLSFEPFVKAPVWVRRAAGQEAEHLTAFLAGHLELRMEELT